MKGLSEMVGAALLIAVVMFAGTLVATWGPTWVAGERAGLACVGQTNYIMESVNFDENTGNLLIKITNFGLEPLYGFDLVLYNGTTSMQIPPEDIDQGGITEDRRLKRSESTYLNLKMEDVTFGRTLDRIIVTNDACPSVTTELKI